MNLTSPSSSLFVFSTFGPKDVEGCKLQWRTHRIPQRFYLLLFPYARLLYFYRHLLREKTRSLDSDRACPRAHAPARVGSFIARRWPVSHPGGGSWLSGDWIPSGIPSSPTRRLRRACGPPASHVSPPVTLGLVRACALLSFSFFLFIFFRLFFFGLGSSKINRLQRPKWW